MLPLWLAIGPLARSLATRLAATRPTMTTRLAVTPPTKTASYANQCSTALASTGAPAMAAQLELAETRVAPVTGLRHLRQEATRETP